jgi:hypothetical protein
MDKRDAKADLSLLEAATKGPWFYYEQLGECDKKLYDTHQGVVWTSRGPGYGAVCEVNHSYPRVPTMANARFIAACPEMVEHWINRAVELEDTVRRKELVAQSLERQMDPLLQQAENLRSALRDAVKALEFYRDNICWFDGWRMTKDLEKVGPEEAKQVIAIANEALGT